MATRLSFQDPWLSVPTSQQVWLYHVSEIFLELFTGGVPIPYACIFFDNVKMGLSKQK